MKYKRRVADGGSPTPSTGNGKLTQYKNRSDSWILNQMENKTIDSPIKRKKNNSNTKFYNNYKKDPKNIKLIASKIVKSSFITKTFTYCNDIVKVFLSLSMTSDIIKINDLLFTTKLLKEEAVKIKKSINNIVKIYDPVFITDLKDVVIKLEINCENINDIDDILFNKHGITKIG